MPLTQSTPTLNIRTRGAALQSRAGSALESVMPAGGGESGESGEWVSGEVAGEERQSVHPWDQAHGVLDNPVAVGLESAVPVTYVEPDFEQEFPYKVAEASSLESALERADVCRPRSLDAAWPNPGTRFGWHLDDEYTELRTARTAVGDPGDGKRIRIGILDTGYDPGHVSLPRHMCYELARNLTGSGPVSNATDPGASFPMTNPGHGTATLGVLAGNVVEHSGPPAFGELLGGAPYAEVVPIRIANSVVHFRTSSMAEGIQYARRAGCQVVSISMGGVPTQIWADAVNAAYTQGVCIFAAAGNRYGVAPPATLVYPARFHRVVGVCGFTSQKTPYYMPGLHNHMHGCFGPPAAMKTAMAAYTPNIPWADMGCGRLVNPDGAGTSSATPQCAAAAALWLQKHRPAPAEKWRIVEAVRHALFSTAERPTGADASHYGQGLLKANAALDVAYRDDLPRSPVDEVSFPWLRLAGALEGRSDKASARQAMLETEALQLYLQTPSLQTIADNADPHSDSLERSQLKAFLQRLEELPTASKTLRTFAKQTEKVL
jgi:subtilisin family serine protease